MSHESRDAVMATLAMANFLAQTQGIPKAKNGQTSGQRLLGHAARALQSGGTAPGPRSRKRRQQWNPGNAIISRLE